MGTGEIRVVRGLSLVEGGRAFLTHNSFIPPGLAPCD